MPRKRKGKVPRGAYPLPNGNWAIESSSTAKSGKRNVKVVGELRAEPDAALIAKAIILQAREIAGLDR